jgi:hypothetical protein
MPVELSFAERRILGVLIEKGYTTPEQYPLTLNAVVVGSNQKSCRDPVSALDEEAAIESLDSLRRKGFVIQVRTEGSRADRWKHRTGECLGLEPKEVALLAELLLRGPQTDGELRQRASRMVPLGDLDETIRIVEGLVSRDDPLVRRLTPPERRRGARFAHAFYPAEERPEGSSGSSTAQAEEAAMRPLAREEAPFRSQRPDDRVDTERADPGSPGESGPGKGQWSGPGLTPAAARPESTVSPNSGTEDLMRRIKALEERVEELEATFVKFLR